ncbi:MAG: acyl-CoA dehydrogenase family protein [Candidatus Dormibacteraeota bacterium]|nr:acyl-CoA dehydrogenase family protein [Candidatus Dormibacteraeota bacterium]
MAEGSPGALGLDLPVPEHIRPQVVQLREFVEREIRPIEERHASRLVDERDQLDASGKLIPEIQAAKEEIRRAAGAAGYHALQVPAELGGGGMSPSDLMYMQEEVYRDGLRLTKEVLPWTEGPSPLLYHLSPQLRERYLGRLMRGEVSACFAATEPNVGSDLTALETSAKRDGDGWVLTGHKAFITGAPFAQFALVVAQTSAGSDREGLAVFLVDAETQGYRVGRMATTMIEDGNTSELHLDHCRVPDSHRIGEVGQGLALAMLWINWARIRRGGMCSGLGQFCLEASLRYSSRRRAFGGPLRDLPAVGAMLSQMYVDLYTMRSTSIHCLEQIERLEYSSLALPPAAIRATSVMKLANDEALFKIADTAIQVHGARGLTKSAHLEKIFRVARNLRIPAGTTEIQGLTIARTLRALEI